MVTTTVHKHHLVGGFNISTHLKKHIRQIGSFPQFSSNEKDTKIKHAAFLGPGHRLTSGNPQSSYALECPFPGMWLKTQMLHGTGPGTLR